MTNPDFITADDVSTGPGFHPDGLTRETITVVQREVDRALRREGYPVQDRQPPTTRRSAPARVEPHADRTCDPTGEPPSAATTSAPESCASPQPDVTGQPGGTRTADDAGPSTGEPAGDPVPTLFTPAQAANLLQVPESWLRRRAARRLVPSTFLGKHLRFAPTNLHQIITDAARPSVTRPASGPNTAPRRRGRPPLQVRTDSRRPTR
ncbi:hypothetical protein [Amycolatopsis panacis]|uniref:hypothetical protein n=1 Tax=Amycolatopsis panacis TaxID=2340917 RepID=UPI0018F4496F|nr:hypothetical protein [Amycolatopsis panacis]